MARKNRILKRDLLQYSGLEIKKGFPGNIRKNPYFKKTFKNLGYILHGNIVGLDRLVLARDNCAGFDLKVLAFLEHLFDKIFAADLLQMTDALILVAMLRAILWINVLARIDFDFELVLALLQRAVHYHGNDFGVIVLERLVFNIHIFRLGPFTDTVPVLSVFRAILGNMDPKKDLSATRILAFLFPEFLSAP
jgi:hypothetical protein